jgi:hypothetical protein
MHAVYRTEAPPGIAARWFIDRLKHSPAEKFNKQGSRAGAIRNARARRPRLRKR